MANEQNLVSLKNRTTTEQRAIARAGGIASGEARRQKKTLRELGNMIGSLQVNSEKNRAIMREAGIADEDMIRDTEALFRISLKAQQGDVKAAEFLAKLRGELGSDNPFAGVNIESVTINFGKKEK